MTKNYKLLISNINRYISLDLPIICPYCSTTIHPILLNSSHMSYNNMILNTLIFKGNCCDKSFYATYTTDASYNNSKLLNVYPMCKSVKLPDTIVNLSPRFVKLYNDSYTAEQMGAIELAGTGYRNAMEILIKDFAIIKLKHSSEEVANKNLHQCIKTYLKELNIDTSAHVVRILGNDLTHYEANYQDVDFKVVKRYLDIFIHQIDTNILLLEPLVEIKNS